MTGTYVPIGAVLVVERRKCLKCSTIYLVPAHQLAQLYCAPHDPAQHAISPSKEIKGSKRVIHYTDTTSECCQNCIKTNLNWDQVSQLKLVVPHLPADVAPYEDYATACSVRDRLKNDLAKSFTELEKAQKKFKNLTFAYGEAKAHAKSLARAHKPDEPAYRYSTKPTKMRDIFTGKEKPEKEVKVIVPATDDEI